MALAVDIMQGCGPSNKIRHQLQLKKTKVRKALLAVNIAAKGILCAMRCTLLTKRSMVLAVHITQGHGLSDKMRHQLQPKKTKVRLE